VPRNTASALAPSADPGRLGPLPPSPSPLLGQHGRHSEAFGGSGLGFSPCCRPCTASRASLLFAQQAPAPRTRAEAFHYAKADRNRRISKLRLAYWTQQEIAQAAGISHGELAKTVPNGKLGRAGRADVPEPGAVGRRDQRHKRLPKRRAGGLSVGASAMRGTAERVEGGLTLQCMTYLKCVRNSCSVISACLSMALRVPRLISFLPKTITTTILLRSGRRLEKG
jgi:hypothetical protein